MEALAERHRWLWITSQRCLAGPVGSLTRNRYIVCRNTRKQRFHRREVIIHVNPNFRPRREDTFNTAREKSNRAYARLLKSRLAMSEYIGTTQSQYINRISFANLIEWKHLQAVTSTKQKTTDHLRSTNN
jgi:hypothetical protein